MFSKSKTKRFQDPVSSGPAPGQYDVKDIKSSAKGVVFEKDKRWRDPSADSSHYSSSMENLSASGSFKSLVPLSQSTCTKKQPNKSSKRKSCFVSSSATDLTSRFPLDADIEFQSDKIQELQAKIMKLEAEISKLKSAAKDSVDISAEEIVNEKLAIELEKRNLEEKYDSLMKSYDEIIKEKTVREGLIEEQEKKFSSLESKHLITLQGIQDELLSAKNLNQEYTLQIENIKSTLATDFQKANEKYDTFRETFDQSQMQYLHRIVQSNVSVTKCKGFVSQLSDQLQLEKDAVENLNAQLNNVIKESQKEKISSDEEKEMMLIQINDLESHYEVIVNKLKDELKDAKDLNMDYCEQIEYVETSMTDNIREISKKYETLETTFDQTSRKYQQRLERSKAVVEKTIEANRKLNSEYENVQQMYADLQQKHTNLNKENESIIMESNKKFKEYKEQTRLLHDQINEKDVRIKSIENFVVETEKDLAEKTAKLDDLQLSVTTLSNEVEKKEQLLFEYQSKNEILSKKIEESMHETNELKSKVEGMITQEEHQSTIQSLKDQNGILDEQLEEYQKNEQELLEQLNENKVLFEEYDRNVCKLSEELDTREKMLLEKDNQIEVYESRVEALSEEVKTARSSVVSEEEMNELQTKLEDAENAVEEWRLKYEDLEKKVGPFMDQLEQFQLEKRSLLDQNSLTQQEMKKLSERYGQILGHQNNKQKIRHISKLKDENYQLKAEVMKLRATTQKDKVRINQLERASEGKRFGKENGREPFKSVN